MAERDRAFADLSNSEREVRRQFAQLATIYRAAPVGLGFIDSQLRYVGVNNYLADFNGLAAEAHQGRTIREVLPQLADMLEPIYQRVLATGEPVLDVEKTGHNGVQPGLGAILARESLPRQRWTGNRFWRQHRRSGDDAAEGSGRSPQCRPTHGAWR